MFDGLPTSEALRQYPNKLLITEGKNGVRYFDGTKDVLVPGVPVEAVDTTGAGDTFNGALAVALTEGKSLYDALAFANLAASMSRHKVWRTRRYANKRRIGEKEMKKKTAS
ncbi:hypothetical protein BsIDN1_63810 [Bacillus safensis]|uniref:Carbohydrate kinase PfkB domain-containing protein n=1 Tax=Bacillus safensis TaxID=561879 RepID=A0A5S9MI31_BACIA|nr:hypothetical protein BsIDN1_63810 [Bacillus safensis]